MPFRPGPVLPDYEALRSTLVAASEQIENYTLYQTVIGILDSNLQGQTIFRNQIQELQTTINLNANARSQIHPFLVMGA